MTTHNIVCLSTQLWEDPMWTNKQHVMSRLAERDHKVLYVDPLIRVRKLMNNVVLKRIYTVGRVLTFQKKINDNLTILSPVKFLFSAKKETKFNLRLINKTMDQLGINDPILWVYDPDFADYVDHIPHKLLIYDCVDDYSSMPPERYKGKDREEIIRKEKELVKKSDLVFTTSEYLFKVRKEQNNNTYYTPNVADFDHNKKALSDSTPIPKELENIPHPIVGFQGNLSQFKFDFDLIEAVVKSKPDWQFVFVGPVETSKTLTDFSRHLVLEKIMKRENVHFMGVKPYEELPSYYKAFDVAMMPNQINEYNRSSFPLKFFEFLGAGLPVVMTPLPALKKFYDIEGVYVSKSKEDFTHLLQKALNKGKGVGQEERLLLAKEYSWDKKVENMLSIINKELYDE